MEFGTTPFPEGLQKSVERGKLYGVPTFRWIGGRKKVKTAWTAFLAEIPGDFAGVEDVRLAERKIIVKERGTAREISVECAHPAF